MQRHNSLTSLYSVSSSRSGATDYTRDSSTSALLDDRQFAKKSRRTPAPPSKPVFNFSNGETFTPRTTGKKRNKPARMTSYPNRPLTKSPSMVSVPTSSGMNSTSHSFPKLKHSHSFSNLREQSKQSLIDAIRTDRLDTPTNIVLPTPAPAPSQRHSYSLTNNRYCENSSNIVRNESLTDSTTHLRLSTSDSNPSSLSNYNRSGSNTPQTSVSGSEIASERIEGSTESVSSSTNGKELCSLESIKELSGYSSPHEMQETTTLLSSSTEQPQKSAPTSNTEQSESGTSQNQASAPSESTPISMPRSSAKTGGPSSSSSSSSASSYRSISKADDPDSISQKRNTSDTDSLCVSEKNSQDEAKSDGSDSSSHPESDEGSTGSPHDEPRAAIGDTNNSDSESEGSESDAKSGIMTSFSPELKDAEMSKRPIPLQRIPVPVLDKCDSSCELPDPSLPEPTLSLESPNHETYLKVGSRISSDKSEINRFEQKGRNLKGLTISTTPPQTPKTSSPGATLLVQSSVPPTPISKNSAPPTPISKSTAPPTPISKSSLPTTPIEVISDSDSTANSISEARPESRLNQVSGRTGPKGTEITTSASPKSSASFNSGGSSISVKKVPKEMQQPKAVFKSMLLSDDGLTKSPEVKLMKRPDLRPESRGSHLPEHSPPAPSPISKDSVYVNQIDPVVSTPIENGDLSSDTKSDIKDAKDDSKVDNTLTGFEDSVSLDGNAYYSPVQIDKFFADEQAEVPPRGDLDVNNGFLKVHKRNNSSIGSVQSMDKKVLPGIQKLPEMPPKRAQNLPQPPQVRKSFTPTTARYSMLAVVDVDYDKSLPGTPNNVKRRSELHRDFQNALNFDVDAKSLPSSAASSPAMSPEKPSVLKKFSRFLSSGTKERQAHRLNSKSSSSSMNKPARDSDDKISTKSAQVDQTKDTKMRPSPLDIKKAKKKRLFLNLKLGSSSHVDDLPSPVYSVRERQSPGTQSQETTPVAAKFDLPNYEVEKDVFNDVLMRFDEVEKEVEKDLVQLRKSNSIHDFFAKDDELTNAQIVDQKRKDNYQSDESLPSKFSLANSSYESVSAADAKPLPHDSYSGITDDIISQMLQEEQNSEFPIDESEKIVSVSRQQLQSAYHEPKGSRKQFWQYAKQFADFPEVEIKLKGFEPFKNSDDTRSNSLASEQQSILKKSSNEERNSPKSVKFSNSISISETYAPYMYKRNNKAVTQYYVNDLNQISRIKNELNAFKCYEMLVHEKSQTNTQFFY